MAKERLQIPVSKEFADHVTELGNCLRLSQSAMAAALLEEGIGASGKVEQWCYELMAAAINFASGTRKVRVDGGAQVYLQTFVSGDVARWLDRMALGLNNTPVRVAASLLESAAHDSRWVIEVLGTKPGKVLARVVKSLSKTPALKARVAAISA